MKKLESTVVKNTNNLHFSYKIVLNRNMQWNAYLSEKLGL